MNNNAVRAKCLGFAGANCFSRVGTTFFAGRSRLAGALSAFISERRQEVFLDLAACRRKDVGIFLERMSACIRIVVWARMPLLLAVKG